MIRIVKLIFFAALYLLLSGSILFASARDDSSPPDYQPSDIFSSLPTSTAKVGDKAPVHPLKAGRFRPSLAVYAFANPDSYRDSTIGEGLADIVITRLASSGRFDIVQRGANLELLMKEAKLAAGGYIDPETAVEVGRIQGVDYLLTGRVTNFSFGETNMGSTMSSVGSLFGVKVNQVEAVVRVDFVLIDATTGATVLAKTASGRKTETGFAVKSGSISDFLGQIQFNTDEFRQSLIGRATIKAVEDLMDQILALFPVQAPLAAVSSDFVILNIGSGVGIKEGDVFKVFRVSYITNSLGERVWENRDFLGEVQVVEITLTRVRAAILSGSGFSEGDVAVLKQPVEIPDEQTQLSEEELNSSEISDTE